MLVSIAIPNTLPAIASLTVLSFLSHGIYTSAALWC